jgi:hypothetical protein
MITSTTDLGDGWFINLIKDEHGVETATVRNCDKGLRIDLSADSMETLRKLLNQNYRVT